MGETLELTETEYRTLLNMIRKNIRQNVTRGQRAAVNGDQRRAGSCRRQAEAYKRIDAKISSLSPELAALKSDEGLEE